MPLPGLFWCRWAAQSQLGPVLAGKGGCPSSSQGASGCAMLEGPAVAVGEMREGRGKGGSRARSNVSTSPSVAPEPGRASPWSWDGNGGAGSGRCRRLIPSEPGGIEAEATRGQWRGKSEPSPHAGIGAEAGICGEKSSSPPSAGQSAGNSSGIPDPGGEWPQPCSQWLPLQPRAGSRQQGLSAGQEWGGGTPGKDGVTVEGVGRKEKRKVKKGKEKRENKIKMGKEKIKGKKKERKKIKGKGKR